RRSSTSSRSSQRIREPSGAGRSCSKRCGTRTGTARRRRSTSMSRPCGRSSATRRGSRLCAASGSASPYRRDRRARGALMKRRLLRNYLSITAFVLLVLEIPLGVAYANSVEGRIVADLQHDAFALALKAQGLLPAAANDAGARAALRAITV